MHKTVRGQVRGWRPLLATVLTASVGMLGAGCGSSASSSSSSSATSSAAGASSTGTASQASGGGVAQATAQVTRYTALQTQFAIPNAPVANAKTALNGKVIWYIPIFLQAPSFGVINSVLVSTFKSLGATVHTCDAAANPSNASACFNQAIKTKAGGIIADALDNATDPAGFAAAVKAHIPVVVSDNAITTGFPPSPDLINSGANVTVDAALQADWVIADSKGRAHVLYATDQSPTGYADLAATKAEFQKNCPSCTFTEVNTNDSTPQNTPSAVSTALIRNQDVNYVVAPFDAPAGSLVLQGAGQVPGRKIKFIANGGQPGSGLARLRAGTQGADVSTDNTMQSWIVTDDMIRLITGRKPLNVSPASRIFTSANDPTNLTSTAAWASGTWFTNLGYEAIYRKLWGVR